MSRVLSFSVCPILSGLFLVSSLAGTSARTEPRIEFELVTERGFSIAASHRWAEFLSDLKLDRLRIRSGTGPERPAIETLGGEPAAIYYVRGV